MAFGLYLVTYVILVVFYVRAYIFYKPLDELLIALVATNTINFFSQLFLIGILWPLARTNPFTNTTATTQPEATAPITQHEENHDEPAIEIFDPEKDENVRVWAQLVRTRSNSMLLSHTRMTVPSEPATLETDRWTVNSELNMQTALAEDQTELEAT